MPRLNTSSRSGRNSDRSELKTGVEVLLRLTLKTLPRTFVSGIWVRHTSLNSDCAEEQPRIAGRDTYQMTTSSCEDGYQWKSTVSVYSAGTFEVDDCLGGVDKVDSQSSPGMIQDCFLGGSFGAKRLKRCGVAYPDIVDACLQSRSVFLAHGTEAQIRISSAMTEEEERSIIRRSRNAIFDKTGVHPRGWAGQDFNQSARTVSLLSEAGFEYTTDWANDDVPYLMNSAPNSLLAMPAQIMWNDLEAMWVRKLTPDEWASAAIQAFEALAGKGGAYFNLSLHPFVSGQAYRYRALRRILTCVTSSRRALVGTTDEIAALARRELLAASG